MSERRVLGQHFGPGGKPKRAFASQAAAARFLMQQQLPSGTRVYLCDFCDRWHLASPPRRRG